MGMAKLTHLESIVSTLDEGIQEIKHLLITMGKTPMSSSAPLNESSPHEATSRRPLGEQGKPYHAASQPMEPATKHLLRRLELPTFGGDDPNRWIYRAELYFEINGLHTKERLRATMICMEGEALAWYSWEEGHYQFKELLLLQFRSSQAKNLPEQLMSLFQTSTVHEY